MERAELTLVVAGALVAAIMLGWILRWLFGRLNAREPTTSVTLAARLAEAEMEREAAVADLAAVLRQRDEAIRAGARGEAIRADEGPDTAHKEAFAR